ncbi:N-(5'-phosphoribosyl)anthranilate isomerase [Dyadobacter sp. CECT 9275]|uniref:N-(5'-phosphoribosyl)anthranilate isomerase n=1 Tax=Dyadobacter helix TaxID=2822344 RepID=A0A916JBI1_9BACT|nr:hypothetical protein [Dyadobacter sp. CECT 9275]CAG4993354.1 N-(5'-phosphoribosyl)anthranilate isomerase [Dyadobacter sp. CECT 9275]
MLTNTVKISNVSNLSDARYCAGMGVEMLGFSIDENAAAYISPKKFEDICSWLAGVTLVAETSLTDPEKIIQALAPYPVHSIQVTESNLLGYLKSELGLPLILRVSADQYDAGEMELLMSRYADDVAHFLLESDDDSPLSDEWIQTSGNLSKEYPILVGFGLENESTVTALTTLFPKIGIALKGSEEIRPGFKDFGSMMDILEALEEN